MFQVGIQYIKKGPGNAPLTCVWADEEVACLKGTLGVTLRYAEDFKYYTEYKEPIKHVKYFNIYRDWIASGVASRRVADALADGGRIGCVRVEFTEGQYDD